MLRSTQTKSIKFSFSCSSHQNPSTTQWMVSPTEFCRNMKYRKLYLFSDSIRCRFRMPKKKLKNTQNRNIVNYESISIAFSIDNVFCVDNIVTSGDDDVDVDYVDWHGWRCEPLTYGRAHYVQLMVIWHRTWCDELVALLEKDRVQCSFHQPIFIYFELHSYERKSSYTFKDFHFVLVRTFFFDPKNWKIYFLFHFGCCFCKWIFSGSEAENKLFDYGFCLVSTMLLNTRKVHRKAQCFSVIIRLRASVFPFDDAIDQIKLAIIQFSIDGDFPQFNRTLFYFFTFHSSTLKFML